MKKLAQTSTRSSSRLQEMVMVVMVEVKAKVKKTTSQMSVHCSFGLYEIVRDVEVKAKLKRHPRRATGARLGCMRWKGGEGKG